MTAVPSFAEALGHLSRLLLRSLRASGGSVLFLSLSDSGRLLWRIPLTAWDEATREEAQPALAALGSWTVSEHPRSPGPQLELAVDLGERALEFQSPEVLLVLRSVAAENADIGFRLELPAGVRDIQRARAGLPSRPARSG